MLRAQIPVPVPRLLSSEDDNLESPRVGGWPLGLDRRQLRLIQQSFIASLL